MRIFTCIGIIFFRAMVELVPALTSVVIDRESFFGHTLRWSLT